MQETRQESIATADSICHLYPDAGFEIAGIIHEKQGAAGPHRYHNGADIEAGRQLPHCFLLTGKWLVPLADQLQLRNVQFENAAMLQQPFDVRARVVRFPEVDIQHFYHIFFQRQCQRFAGNFVAGTKTSKHQVLRG